MTLRIDGRTCTLSVTDCGGDTSFDGTAPPPTDDASDLDALLPSGRGLALMSALMDTMSFRPVDGGTSVGLVKQLHLTPGSPLELLAFSGE